MTTPNKQIHTNEFITRNEFSAFEKTVDANFAESKQSQAEIRHVLNNLTSKIDSMANKGLDLKTLFGGIMVIIAIMGGISSLISWGLNDKMTSQEALAKEGRTAIKESLNEKVSSIVDFVEKLEKQNSVNHDRLVALVEKEVGEVEKHFLESTNNKLETINSYIKALSDRLGVSEATLMSIMTNQWSRTDNDTQTVPTFNKMQQDITSLREEASASKAIRELQSGTARGKSWRRANK